MNEFKVCSILLNIDSLEHYQAHYDSIRTEWNENQKQKSTPSIESTTDNSSTNEEVTYILNTNSKKIHRPNCSAVNNMKAQNKEETYKSIEELEAEGYAPCGICKP